MTREEIAAQIKILEWTLDMRTDPWSTYKGKCSGKRMPHPFRQRIERKIAELRESLANGPAE